MDNRKSILLLVLVVILTYSNSLSNKFIGDDVPIFIDNNFYHDLKNIPKILSKEFILRYEDVDFSQGAQKNSFSGFVSFRPVVALTFFFDYYLWHDNPFGHHLTNILLHALVSCLMFYFVQRLFPSGTVALWAAFFFAVHPVQAEVVNSIGYRSDLLVTIFYLLSLLAYIQYTEASPKKGGLLCLAYLFFFLTLFSKESAVTLPVMAIVYGLCFASKDKDFLKSIPRYSVFLMILAFYLWAYGRVFPNANSSVLYSHHFDILTHAKLIIQVFSHYLTGLLNPMSVKLIPPLYAPSVNSLSGAEGTAVILFLLILLFIAIRSFVNKDRAVTFFIAWFILTYLPTSNIILLPNPMAFRFLYLPSVGFFVFLAVLFERGLSSLSRSGSWKNLGLIFKTGTVIFLMSLTFPLNMLYKDSFISCREMIRNYPDAKKPYLNLGLMYLSLGYHEEAREHLKKYLAADSRNSFVDAMAQDYYAHHQLGRTYIKNPDAAIAEFKESARLRPDYAAVYADLAHAYLLKNDSRAALRAALRAIELDERLIPAYVFAIHCYHELKNDSKARELLRKALDLAPGDSNLLSLKKILEPSS